jgi:hypothetical protein
MSAFDPNTFSAAWNTHDIDAILRMSTDDCEFHGSAGSAPSGNRHVGPVAVRAAYEAIFAAYPDAEWSNSRSTFLGPDRVLTEWCFKGTGADGKRIAVDGLDLLELRDGKVWIKNSYRKSVS